MPPKRKAAAAAAPINKKARATRRPVSKVTEPTAPEPKAPIEPKAPSKQNIGRKLAVPVSRQKKAPQTLNAVPQDIINVFVCGEGSAGELGLGPKTKDVKRPRENKLLNNIVAVATGGMHVLALDTSGQVLSWGVNDDGALGRDTKKGAQFVDASDSDDDSDMNPAESTPAPIATDNIPEGTRFTAIAAGDCYSVAVTETGRIYSWGAFRSNDGHLGYNPKLRNAWVPMLMEDLKNITTVKCGSHHVLAIDKDGQIFAWGAGQQHQLARTVVARTEIQATRPTKVILKEGHRRFKAKSIACGAFNSFAIDEHDRVWAWGLNNRGQTGFPDIEGEPVITVPSLVPVLNNMPRPLKSIDSGDKHSIAVDSSGTVWAFGDCSAGQVGINLADLDKSEIRLSELGKPSAVPNPQRVTGIPASSGVFCAAGPQHNLVLTASGRAFSWGFSVNYQTGLGEDGDINTPELIDNTATRDRHLVWCGAGGQYSAFAAKA